jgi:D-xylose 1-dehydrogenase (NADP+, D-xylono-1,5-lactone-forming)
VSVAWGLLSTARINRLVLAGARKSDRVDVVAVASRNAESAESYAREHGIERALGSYEALLEDDGVEAVYISLPNSMHIEWSVRALEAGKHVLCEKPLTRRAAEAERAFDAADRSGRLLMEAFMYRHHPQTARLKALLGDGAIGRLQLIRAAFSFTVADPANIRLLGDLDGGALMDVGCYCVSGSRLLAGEPVEVHAEQVIGPGGADIRFAATMRFADDVIGQFDCGLDLPVRDELEVFGSEGSLFLDDPWHARSPVIELRRDDGTEQIEVEPADSYQLELENLSDAIRGEATPLLGRDDAVGQARTIEALYRAAET